jgi:hypothetical protein
VHHQSDFTSIVCVAATSAVEITKCSPNYHASSLEQLGDYEFQSEWKSDVRGGSDEILDVDKKCNRAERFAFTCPHVLHPPVIFTAPIPTASSLTTGPVSGPYAFSRYGILWSPLQSLTLF